jgi:hypothetical protein
MEISTKPNSAVRQWLWFVGLWTAGVSTTGAISLVIRFWLM